MPEWHNDREKLLARLLLEILKALKFDIPAIDLSQGGYAPEGWNYREDRSAAALDYLIELKERRNVVPLWVQNLHYPAKDQPAPPLDPAPRSPDTAPMGTGTLTIDLDAVVANWRALDRLSAPHVETAAVVKADAYGLGAGRVARALARAGARRFFVAQAEEGATVRSALGHGPQVCVFAGHMSGDTALLRDLALVPMLTSPDQAVRHAEAMPGSPFGVQLDTGMHRLGLTPADWRTWRDVLLNRAPVLLMSHLACADDPHDAMNARQLALFARMTDGAGVPRTLAATGGILLGDAWHFDVVRPGIGLYGGAPFEAAAPVVRLSLPVIQVRDVAAGGTVGYSAAWIAESDARIATVAAGYADGLLRAMGDRAVLFAGDVPCPLAGRVSMDLMTVDVTHLAEVPESLDILAPSQTVDDLAAAAATIGYEILTSLGPRYARRYTGATGPAPHPRAPIRREPLQRTTRSR